MKTSSSTVSNSIANPAEVALVIDVSGSMDDAITIGKESYRKLEYAENAAITFVSLMRLGKDSLGVCSFDTEGEFEWGANNKVQELKDVDVRTQAVNAILGLETGGRTDMYKGLEFAGKMFSDLKTDKKAIVLLSDGKDNEDDAGEDEEVLARQLNTDGKSIYTVAVGNSADKKKLAAIAGSAKRAIDVPDAFQLNKAFNDIIDQIGIAKVLVNEIIDIPATTHMGSVHPLKDNIVPDNTDALLMAIVWDNYKTYSWAGVNAPFATRHKVLFNPITFDENGVETKVDPSNIEVVKEEPGVVVLRIKNPKAGDHYGCQMFTHITDNDQVRFSVGIFAA